ncbi:hypothetical protein ACFVS2_25915 [Brevibacillus sp. NPDC058079]|uniref:hypothetical protein n=1 Tax=Brevibacillus sp. NPDC058079 TaxID=3346330 RepID=UPI0036E4CFE5
MNDMDLQKWAVENEPSEEMIYYGGYWNQILFIRDRLTYLFFGSIVNVIGTHVSKSVQLPVVQFDVASLGISFVIRGNFYDWKVSVESERPIECEFYDLFNKDATWSHHYCEGFPLDRIYNSILVDNRRFTIELSDEFAMHTFFWLISNHL